MHSPVLFPFLQQLKFTTKNNRLRCGAVRQGDLKHPVLREVTGLITGWCSLHPPRQH